MSEKFLTTQVKDIWKIVQSFGPPILYRHRSAAYRATQHAYTCDQTTAAQPIC